MGIYTIGLIAHSGAGKTSLGEALLNRSGALRKMGAVDDGTAALDFEVDERERKTSLHMSVGHLKWKDHSVDLIDTPGSMNFIGSIVGAIRVIDGAI
ncbi:MAG: GTP-binding protein, partial [bacterium]